MSAAIQYQAAAEAACFGTGWCWPWQGIAAGTPEQRPQEWRWHFYRDTRDGSRSACGKWTFDANTDHLPLAEPDLSAAPHVCRLCRRAAAVRGAA